MDNINKEIAVLSHLTEIQRLLAGDQNLANELADKLEVLSVGKDLRGLLMSRRSELSYYNEKCGMELAPILEQMLQSRLPQEFKVSTHPGMSVRTLYLKVYQPWLWLMDKHPDPVSRAKYSNLRRDTKISQMKHAVRIRFRNAVGDNLVPDAVNEDMDGIMKLQKKISDFLEMDITQDTMLDEKNLSLSQEQMDGIKDSLAGIPEDRVKLIVESSRLRILRKVTL
jgi:hypothetical protein